MMLFCALTHLRISFTPPRTSIMSGSLARIPIHRCSSVPNFTHDNNINSPTTKPNFTTLSQQDDFDIDTMWCDCPDSLLNYVPHKICLKSKLYDLLNTYLLHHPCPSESYLWQILFFHFFLKLCVSSNSKEKKNNFYTFLWFKESISLIYFCVQF